MGKNQNKYSVLSKILEPELLKELMKLPVLKFEKGFIFPGYKEIPSEIPLVIKGFIDISLEDEKGRRYTVYTIHQGESCIITMNAVIRSTQNKGQQGLAGVDTEMLAISDELSKNWIDKYPSWRKFIFDLYSKRLNELLVQHDLVAEQKDQISIKSEEIKSSINYALKIQTAVMPSKEELNKVLSDYFIFNKPKDIVSGDFYWVEQFDNKLIVVAADSTGHGVPGAFMSMLGISMLNEIANKENCYGAGQILTELRRKTKLVLKQSGGEEDQKDGFDIALCLIDLKNKNLEFAGAYNPLYLIRNGELQEIKADKMPVGIHVNEKEIFTTHKVELKKGDNIYMFSDGFMDQFGGEQNQKFKSKSFKSLIKSIHKKPLKIQESILSETFEKWKGKTEQTDDVLIFGIKI